MSYAPTVFVVAIWPLAVASGARIRARAGTTRVVMFAPPAPAVFGAPKATAFPGDARTTAAAAGAIVSPPRQAKWLEPPAPAEVATVNVPFADDVAARQPPPVS